MCVCVCLSVCEADTKWTDESSHFKCPLDVHVLLFEARPKALRCSAYEIYEITCKYEDLIEF